MRFGKIDDLPSRVAAGMDGARRYLLSLQHEDGYWCGELEADSMLEADYIFVHTLLGTADEGKFQRAMTEIWRYQNADGGWSIYPGGPSNISLSVKCYFAGKLMGISPDHPDMARAREWILAHGGVVARTRVRVDDFGGRAGQEIIRLAAVASSPVQFFPRHAIETKDEIGSVDEARGLKSGLEFA